MKLRKNIATSESGLIFNPGTGDSFTVNQIGSDILSRMKEDIAVEEILSYLLEKYDAERLQLEKDIDDFLAMLNDYNLIEK